MIPICYNENKKNTHNFVNSINKKDDDSVDDRVDDSVDEFFDENVDDEYDELKYNNLRTYIDTLYNDLLHPDTVENSFLYTSIDSLNKDLLNYNFTHKQKIHVCAYQINTETEIPFLQFFLLDSSKHHSLNILKQKLVNMFNKYNETSEFRESLDEFSKLESTKSKHKLVFPSFKYDKNKMYDVLEICHSILDIYYLCYEKTMDKDRCVVNTYGLYKGFNVVNEEIYIFFDCSLYKIPSHYLYTHNDLYLTLIDEIINKSGVYDKEIDSSVIDLFLVNPSLMVLTNRETGNPYPIPLCVYCASNDYKIEFSLIFGQTPNENFKNYFTFTDYLNSLENAKQIKNEKEKETHKSIKTAIIRYAVFSENMKILNKYEYENFENNEFDDESYYFCEYGKPCWIIKKYSKHTPLSAYYLDLYKK